MSWLVHVLLKTDARTLGREQLRFDFKDHFSASGLDTIEEEEDPFDPEEKNLLLTFNDWWIRVFVESGPAVCDDCRVISEQLGSRLPLQFHHGSSRYRVLFATDEDRRYTDQHMLLFDYFESKQDVAIVDPRAMQIVD